MSRGMNDDEILNELEELLATAESDDDFGFDGKYMDLTISYRIVK